MATGGMATRVPVTRCAIASLTSSLGSTTAGCPMPMRCFSAVMTAGSSGVKSAESLAAWVMMPSACSRHVSTWSPSIVTMLRCRVPCRTACRSSGDGAVSEVTRAWWILRTACWRTDLSGSVRQLTSL